MAGVLAEPCGEGDCEEDTEVVRQPVVEGVLKTPCTVRVGAEEALPPPAPPSPSKPEERDGVLVGLPAALLDAAREAVPRGEKDERGLALAEVKALGVGDRVALRQVLGLPEALVQLLEVAEGMGERVNAPVALSLPLALTAEV